VELIKQRSSRDCGVCVAAMLTGTSYESVLADISGLRGPIGSDVDRLRSEPGVSCSANRADIARASLLCFLSKETENDPTNSHAIAIDEQKRVLILRLARPI